MCGFDSIFKLKLYRTQIKIKSSQNSEHYCSTELPLIKLGMILSIFRCLDALDFRPCVFFNL